MGLPWLYMECRRGSGGLICGSKLMMSNFAQCFSFEYRLRDSFLVIFSRRGNEYDMIAKVSDKVAVET